MKPLTSSEIAVINSAICDLDDSIEEVESLVASVSSKSAHRLVHPVLGSWLFKCPVYIRYEYLHHGRLIKVRAVRDLSPRQRLLANPKNCFDVVIAEIDVTHCSISWFDYECEEYDNFDPEVVKAFVDFGCVSVRSKEDPTVSVDDMAWLYEIAE